MNVKTARLLDSQAVLAYYQDEAAAEKVTRILNAGSPLHLSLINWGEVLYTIGRTGGSDAMQRAAAHLDALPITIEPVDRDLILQAARLKARGGLSYADAVCAATAMRLGATIVTGDSEFKTVEDVVKIEWL